jgi:hypothetical protein
MVARYRELLLIIAGGGFNIARCCWENGRPIARLHGTTEPDPVEIPIEGSQKVSQWPGFESGFIVGGLLVGAFPRPPSYDSRIYIGDTSDFRLYRSIDVYTVRTRSAPVGSRF